MSDERKVAEWCRWRESQTPDDPSRPWRSPGGNAFSTYPDFRHSLDAWPPVFLELDRRGLMSEFARELREVFANDHLDAIWLTDHNAGIVIGLVATAEQRFRAALKVIEQEAANG